MNRFEDRWRACVRAAREAGLAGAGSMPDPEDLWRGVVRRRIRDEAAGVAGGGEEVEAWWRWYGVRGVAVAVLLLLGSVLFAVQGGGGSVDAGPFRPGVEDVVAEAFWLL